MRVACISATPLSMAPITAAFADFAAAAGKSAKFELQHLLDDSLSTDLAASSGGLDASFDARFLSLARGAVQDVHTSVRGPAKFLTPPLLSAFGSDLARRLPFDIQLERRRTDSSLGLRFLSLMNCHPVLS